ncbi:MAG: hypothetical protein ACLGRW_03865 [Acidobacteriota bacterium]
MIVTLIGPCTFYAVAAPSGAAFDRGPLIDPILDLILIPTNGAGAYRDLSREFPFFDQLV